MLTRRDFLKYSAIGAGGLFLPSRLAFGAQPKNIIFDDDLGTDCDGSAGLATVCAMARRYEFRLIACMGAHHSGATNNGGPGYAAPIANAIVNYYGIPGVVYGKCADTNIINGGAQDAFGVGLVSQFSSSLSLIGTTDAAYTNATTQYATVLDALPSGQKATIIASGFANNLANALAASGGVSRFTNKVAEIIFVAGWDFLTGARAEAWNVANSLAAAQYLTDNIGATGVTLTWCGIDLGETGLYSRPPTGDSPTVNPVKYSFDNACCGETTAHKTSAGATIPETYRENWTIPALLHAAYPEVYTSRPQTNGKVEIDGSAHTVWNSGIHDGQQILALTASTATINAIADWLLNLPRGLGSPMPKGLIVNNTIKGGSGTFKLP